jgi:sterol desaturase/sphingolipid hydroxylase (fatty acid hydroxylase superfamily)
MDAAIPHEPAIRAGAFAAVFVAMVLWEVLAPRRALTAPKALRWLNNLAVLVLGAALSRLVAPAAVVGAAIVAEREAWGLFNLVAVPPMLAVAASILLLDLTVWGQHLAMHKVPALWRLHRMHHADVDIDVTTGLRFHPLEILLSLAIKCAAAVALGAPPIAVLVFEVLLNATSIFNHANARLPPALDRALRTVLVTPDMHRVHHSWERVETDSNYGFNLPWWDRLFGTYRAQPAQGHERMTIGLHEFRGRRELWIDRMLLQPAR